MADLPLCACGEFWQSHHPECPARRQYERLREALHYVMTARGGHSFRARAQNVARDALIEPESAKGNGS